jgi:nitrogen fixation/metabolism regulation signal transduction histidine kinase
MEITFAPAERAPKEEVRRSFTALKSQLPYDAILDLIPDISLIVNDRRQVLFANSAALSALGLELSEVLGERPGEALDCVHASETPGGCGSSESCRVCGAASAILEAFESRKKISRECRITAHEAGGSKCLDALVTAAPIDSAMGKFAVVTLQDIGDRKRREVLERLFFHDLMNGLSSLQSCICLIRSEFGSRGGEHDYLSRLTTAMERVIDEVSQQRDILTMENGDLKAEIREIDATKIAKDVIRLCEIADYAKGKRLTLHDGRADRFALSDPVILRRVMLNMLKNALEASGPGEEVRLELKDAGAGVAVSVHNPGYIPPESQLQVFQRSFSTKGKGRGLGTYSMKILTEEYLGGKIDFDSDEEGGTTFRLTLPKERPEAQ